MAVKTKIKKAKLKIKAKATKLAVGAAAKTAKTVVTHKPLRKAAAKAGKVYVGHKVKKGAKKAAKKARAGAIKSAAAAATAKTVVKAARQTKLPPETPHSAAANIVAAPFEFTVRALKATRNLADRLDQKTKNKKSR